MTREAEIMQTASELLRYNHTTCTQDMLVEAFRCGAEWADEHQKSPWISVEERLPAKYELVLVKTGRGNFYLAEKDSVAQPRDEFAIPQLSSYVNGVIHWMPIPEV